MSYCCSCSQFNISTLFLASDILETTSKVVIKDSAKLVEFGVEPI